MWFSKAAGLGLAVRIIDGALEQLRGWGGCELHTIVEIASRSVRNQDQTGSGWGAEAAGGKSVWIFCQGERRHWPNIPAPRRLLNNSSGVRRSFFFFSSHALWWQLLFFGSCFCQLAEFARFQKKNSKKILEGKSGNAQVWDITFF